MIANNKSETPESTNKVFRLTADVVWNKLETYNTLLVFLLMLLISSILSSNFFTAQNLNNILRQNAAISIVSMGMLLVILTGGIDLSVGSIMAVSSIVLALLLKAQVNLVLAIIITLAAATLFGAFNGFFIAYRKMPAFVVTLAVMMIGSGFAYIFSKGAVVLIKNKAIVGLGSGFFLGIPRQIYVSAVVFVIILLILRYTSYGRIVMAVGSNQEAVRLSGIRVNTYIFSVYCMSGLFSGMAGVLNASRTAVGSPLLGEGAELSAIAIAVVGGASLSGGKGSAFKTLLGVFILGMISNIMNLIKVPAYTQQVANGFIILGAVFLQTIRTFSNSSNNN